MNEKDLGKCEGEGGRRRQIGRNNEWRVKEGGEIQGKEGEDEDEVGEREEKGE